MKHVPNILTVLRLIVAPIVVYLLFDASATAAVLAFVLFVLASITDWLDGRLARRYQVGSRLGQFLDPLADKVLVLGTFFALAWLYPSIPMWAVALIAFRAVAVTVLRSWMEARGRSLRTSQYGKWKTAAQLTFLIAFLFFRAAAFVTGWPWLEALLEHRTGVLIALLIVVAMTLFSGAHYFWPERPTNDPVS